MGRSGLAMQSLNDNAILVTGGAGFIGSNLVHLLTNSGYKVINLDKLTYSGHLESLTDLLDDPNHIFIQGDIADKELISSILSKHEPFAIMNLRPTFLATSSSLSKSPMNHELA